MADSNSGTWTPFSPGREDIERISGAVADIPAIQQGLCRRHPSVKQPDRVAHQYQIAGSRVTLEIEDELPSFIEGIGLFRPGASFNGVGRLSTGMGCPHIETNPDFLGLMLAFACDDGQRVDFLCINHPASPTDDHLAFMQVLHATVAAAGREMPLVGDWGEYDVGNLLAEQQAFIRSLIKQMGWKKGAATVRHIVGQTMRTFFSSTAWQPYWSGVVELGGQGGKCLFVPERDENVKPGFRPGKHYLSREWRERQTAGPVHFLLYWMPYQNEQETPLNRLTEAWDETHKRRIGRVTFPRLGERPAQERLYSLLAREMGANPGHWIRQRQGPADWPATEFAVARKTAYTLSQQGREALAEDLYGSVFDDGSFSEALCAVLEERAQAKAEQAHADQAPGVTQS